jgi:esterase
MTLQLASDSFGEAGLPIVVLHGLLGSARNWTGIAKQLGESHRVLALDLRNHGRSPWAEAMSFDDMAGDVATFIERSGIAPVVLLGHSLGGKVAMRLALTRGDLVARLVVVDVAPVLYRHSLAEYIEAMRAVDLGRVTRRTEVDDQLGRTIPDTMMRAFLLQNLVRTPEGYAWRAHLDAIAQSLPELMDFPASAGLAYPGPTLFIAGGRSTYVRADHRPLIRRLFPLVEYAIIAGAGHQVHADRPDEFLAALRPFLA